MKHLDFPLILASQNPHKLQEFGSLLPPDWKLEPAPLFACEENAATYLGNALLKAYAVQTLQPDSWVLADDSGLEVEALENRPGIFSARYGGAALTDTERNHLLLKELAGAEERGARFVCCLVLLAPPASSGKRVYIAQSCFYGRIAHQARSVQEKPFGYDPIFELSKAYHPDLAGKTLAELDPRQKNKISHRRLACTKLRNLFSDQ
ncbi:MAG: non-canonical purine NTP pyrophosphatase [Spirochaetota bacterium]